MDKSLISRSFGYLKSADKLSLSLGLLGFVLAIVLVATYTYTSTPVLGVLALLCFIYSATRLTCSLGKHIPWYLKVFAAYIGITLWLTIGISLSILDTKTFVYVGAVLSVPIVCDFFLTIISSFEKDKPEDMNA